MNFESVKLIYVISCTLLGLIILSPTLFTLFHLPGGEGFSELWLLDNNHMIESNSTNVLLSSPYTVYIGVSNQMDNLEYYTIYVKLLNNSQGLLESDSKLPSSAEPIFEYNLFLEDNETWEKDFSFYLQNATFEEKVGHISLLSINGKDVSVDTTSIRDDSNGDFYFKMLFELWIYNSTISVSQYHNRFVQFWISLKNDM